MTPKQIGIAVVLVAAASVVAHYHVAAQTYHPVVRVAAPDGVTYLAVQQPTSERQACGVANARFLRPIKEGCKDCRVEHARCERELMGLEASLAHGERLPYHQIFAPGLHLAIIGAPEPAKAACEFIAADMHKRGVAAAACVERDRLPPT